MKTFILLMLINCSALAQFKSLSVDGIISLSERRDTSELKADPASTEDFVIKRNDRYVYAGIRNYAIAATNVILAKGNQFIVIHLSGCTGSAIYGVDGDSLRIERPIKDVRKNPEAWDVIGMFASDAALKKTKTLAALKTEMDDCLKHKGYMGSTIDMGSCREAEILIDRNVFQGFKLLLQNSERDSTATSRRPAVHPPAGFTGDVVSLREFLTADEGSVVKNDFDVAAWIML
jgi:hypothetical protein